MLDFLNDNAGAFSVVFTLVVAAATVFYALLTKQLVDETRRMRAVQTDPHVTVRLEMHENVFGVVVMIIENIGNGPAINVRLFASPDFQIGPQELLSQTGPFKNGISYMAPGQRISFFLAALWGAELESDKFRFSVEASYKSMLGKSEKQLYEIDFRHFEGLTTVGGDPPMKVAAENLKKIAESISRGFRVNTFTSADRKQEKAERDKARRELLNKARAGEKPSRAPAKNPK